jgi:hypothetical protein
VDGKSNFFNGRKVYEKSCSLRPRKLESFFKKWNVNSDTVSQGCSNNQRRRSSQVLRSVASTQWAVSAIGIGKARSGEEGGEEKEGSLPSANSTAEESAGVRP